MTIAVNNKKINFRKCQRDIFSKEEYDIWKAFIEIDKNKIDFEIINECDTCGNKLNDEINWNGVKVFLVELPHRINELKSKSQSNLFHLARQMAFWKKEFKNNTSFYFDGIEYLSVNIDTKRLSELKFECLTYQLVFMLEKEDDSDFDIHGRWIVKWTGNQITGIFRE